MISITAYVLQKRSRLECSILFSTILRGVYLFQRRNNDRVSHQWHVSLDFEHLQVRPIKKGVPLVHIALHRAEHSKHVQIHTGRPSVNTCVWQYHVINQDPGVRAHSGDNIFEDLLRLIIRPVVEDSAKVIEPSSFARVSQRL